MLGMGKRDYIKIKIGGVIKEKGEEEWKDIYEVIIEVIEGYRMKYNEVKIRWKKRMRRDVVKRGVEIERKGMGMK